MCFCISETVLSFLCSPSASVSQPELAALAARRIESCISSNVPGTVSETGKRTTHSGASQTPMHRLFRGFDCFQLLLLPCIWKPKCMLLGGFQRPCSPRGNLPGLWNPDTSQTCCTHPAFAKICCVYQNYFGLSSTGALSPGVSWGLPQPLAVIKSFQ